MLLELLKHYLWIPWLTARLETPIVSPVVQVQNRFNLGRPALGRKGVQIQGLCQGLCAPFSRRRTALKFRSHFASAPFKKSTVRKLDILSDQTNQHSGEGTRLRQARASRGVNSGICRLEQSSKQYQNGIKDSVIDLMC